MQTVPLQKREELKREEEGDQEGQAGTIFFGSGLEYECVNVGG